MAARSSSRVESFRVGSPVGGRSPVRLRDLVPEDSEKEAYQEGETEYSQAESFLWGVGRAKNDRRARKWAEAAASLGVHPEAWKPIKFMNNAHYDTLIKSNALEPNLARRIEAFKAVAEASDAMASA